MRALTDEELEAVRGLVADQHQLAQEFNLGILGVEPPDKPALLSPERGDARADHLEEELQEFRGALKAGDLAGAMDALLDMQYVAHGTLIEMGVCSRAGFEEVHRANMQKARGAVAKRPGAAAHDAVKPANWRAPRFDVLLTTSNADLQMVASMKADISSCCLVETDDGRRVRWDRVGYADVGSTRVHAFPQGVSVVPPSLACEGNTSDLAVEEALHEAGLESRWRPGVCGSAGPVQTVTRRTEDRVGELSHVEETTVTTALGTAASSGFLKDDGEKEVRPELIPAPVILELAKLYARGAKKYAAENWRKAASIQRYVGALERHLLEWRLGHENDDGPKGTGSPHLVQVAWNALTIWMLQRIGAAVDDRPDAGGEAR